jgi:hypothetical protein
MPREKQAPTTEPGSGKGRDDACAALAARGSAAAGATRGAATTLATCPGKPIEWMT